jgi:malic enzyme
MKGTILSRAKSITDDMKILACKTLASLVKDSDISEEHILPDIFDERVPEIISEAIVKANKKD